MINHEQLKHTFKYKEYRDLLDKLLTEGKTTGHDQSPMMIDFARINVHRMNRLDKTVALTVELKEALKTLQREYIWVVLTEGWCGDTAQQIPVFHAVEKECAAISLQLLLRDDNPDVMNQHLTNGGRSIPKLICIDKEDLSEKFVWGPRPAPVQSKVIELMKTKPTVEEKSLMIQTWYNADKTITLQNELTALISKHLR